MRSKHYRSVYCLSLSCCCEIVLPNLHHHAFHAQAFVCHIGFVVDGQPFVIPTGYARDDDVLYFHGSVGSKMLRALESGAGGSTQQALSCLFPVDMN